MKYNRSTSIIVISLYQGSEDCHSQTYPLAAQQDRAINITFAKSGDSVGRQGSMFCVL